MATHRVLLIDDDKELGSLLGDFLGRYEYSCICAPTGKEGLQLLRNSLAGKAGARPVELIILDIMLPDISGFDLCREIRREVALPIVMLSARGDVYDRILGLEQLVNGQRRRLLTQGRPLTERCACEAE